MKIAVCEDNAEQQEHIVKSINKVLHDLDTSVKGYSLGQNLIVDYIENNIRFDVIFMDIVLPDTDGITIAKQLKEIDDTVIIIFLTGYMRYALKGYEAKAFRYLLKPVTGEQLQNVIYEIKSELGRKRSIAIRDNNLEIILPIREIMYMKSDDKNTIICTNNRNYVNRKSLQEYEEELNEAGFFRIHRKYLINMYFVKSIKSGLVILEGNCRLTISRRKEKEFRNSFYKNLEEGKF